MKITPSYVRRHHKVKPDVFLLVLALLVAMVSYGGTCGTRNLPPSEDLEIRTWYDLDAVRDNLDGDHTLINDLDSTTAGYTELASPTANGGKGWEPIGYSTYLQDYFLSGTFDGQGHEIRDLFINRPHENGNALFSATFQDTVIKNLGVTNATITGANYVGGLVGSNPGYVINSYSNANVTGEYRVGGLAGSSSGTVLNSYSSGNVIGNSSVGGLFGVNMGSVNNSHSTCGVVGVDDVGGLVGYIYYGTVSNSYSTGNVTGYSNVGGLVGLNGWEPIAGGSTVSNSYSTGNVNGNQNVGGLVGQNVGSSTANNSFWDTETSGQSTSDGGMGKNTTEMHNVTTFSGTGWNITAVANPSTRNTAYIWNIVNNVTYPFLSWQP
jgi:hypothetical protein